MIDNIDKKILNILQKNARTTNADIARKVGMAPSAILERIRKLEKKDVIQGYEARINPKIVGFGLTAFIFVLAEEGVGSVAGGKEISRLPGVLEVHYCAGQDAYLVKVRAEDTESLAELISAIGRVPAAKNTNSTVVLRTIKETMQLPLAEDRIEKTTGEGGE